MENIHNQYKELATFLKQSLGVLYEVEYLKIENGRIIDEISILEEEELSRSIYKTIDENLIHKKEMGEDIIPCNGNKLYKLTFRFIKDEYENVIGCLYVLFKLSPLFSMDGFLQELMNINPKVEEKEYPKTLEGIENYISDNTDESVGLNKNLKEEILVDLFDMGMFTIKGAVAKVAELLAMSDKSVYRHIANIKDCRGL